jgi:hypothetical protein
MKIQSSALTKAMVLLWARRQCAIGLPVARVELRARPVPKA